MDKVTEQRIKLLHPKISNEIYNLIVKANSIIGKDITIRVVQGLRTFAEQDGLYAQGRTKPGQKVTNSKGGQSYHNYGLAIDFAFLTNNGTQLSWDTNKDWNGNKVADWLEVVQVFIQAGYTWGGTWKTIKDMPHFEKTFGHNWRDLLVLKNTGKVDKDGYVLI